MKIKDLARVDLPREKFETYGEAKLKDHELLAIILGSGIKGLNALELSRKILKELKKNKTVTFKDLSGIKGLGKVKAMKVLATLSLGKRLSDDAKPEMLSPQDVWKLCTDFRDSKREHFVAFYLDSRNRLIERQIVSIGTLNASLVHPREVFEPALRLSAASVIVAHNHPSGSLEPSPDDKEVTKRLKEAGELIGIELIDHVIIVNSAHFSFLQKHLF